MHNCVASRPLVAHIAGRDQVIVPRGDGWLRSYDPPTGELLWEFDINPKQSEFVARETNSHRSDRNYFLAPPVL